MHGFVTDIKSFSETTALSVVPLLAGGGTRLKVVESISRAVPVVSTTVGAFGLDLHEQDGVTRVDGPRGFADAVLRILRAPEMHQQASGKGRERATTLYDWSTIRRQIGELTREVAREARHAVLQPATRQFHDQKQAVVRSPDEGILDG